MADEIKYEDVFQVQDACITPYEYAARLATALWEKHYKRFSPNWSPLPDLMGVLTQIDNMTAGMVLAPDPEDIPG